MLLPSIRHNVGQYAWRQGKQKKVPKIKNKKAYVIDIFYDNIMIRLIVTTS